jgi:SulP family sulfate permease
MLVLIIRFGFVIGLLVGVVVSCLIFAVNYSRISVVKYSFTLDEYGSKVQRSAGETQVLRERGKLFWVLRLRGYLFFGSVVRLVNDARQRIDSAKQSGHPLRVLVLDFAGVMGIDSSSALTLVKLRQTAENSDLRLIFTALQPEMERLLRRERCLRDDEVCLALPDLDRALERCEQMALIDKELSRHEGGDPFLQHLSMALGSTQAATHFLAYSERIELKAGQHLVRQGDASDEVYVIESGRVSILLERTSGPPLRLRSVTSHTCLGEMGLYRNSPRTASIIADVPTVVRRLSREALTRMERGEPQVAMAFHIFIIRTLADRLVSSDKTIAALER